MQISRSRLQEIVNEEIDNFMTSEIKPLEVTGLLEQLEETVKMIETKKQAILDAGSEETRPQMEEMINTMTSQFHNFQATLGAHTASGQQEQDQQQEVSEQDLPQLTGRDPEARKQKHKTKKDKKKQGEKRKKTTATKEKLDELLGFLKGKDPIEKAWAKFERFRKWSQRASEEGRFEDRDKWADYANKWRHHAEQLEREAGTRKF